VKQPGNNKQLLKHEDTVMLRKIQFVLNA